MDPGDVLNPMAAAKFIRKEEKTMRAWRSAKKGPPYIKLPGGSILYLREDLEEWLRSHRVDPERKSQEKGRA